MTPRRDDDRSLTTPSRFPRPLSAPGPSKGFLAALAILAALAGLAPAQPALALVEPEQTPFDAVARPPAWIVEEAEEPVAQEAAPAAQAVAALRQKAGGKWEMPIDRRTGRAMLISGSGIPMVPGAGNRLKKADLPAGILDDRGKPSLAGLDNLVRVFLQENRALFLPDRGELVLNAGRSGVLEEGRVAFVDYDWVVDGVPVEGARVFARINNGNLVQAGTRLVGRLETPTTPRLKEGEALGRALAHAGLEAGGETVVKEGRLILLPVSGEPARYRGPVGGGVGYRLAWDVAFRLPDAAPTWTARVDALSGEVLEFYDANQYAGQVVGGVFPRTVSDQEVLRPFPLTTWTGSGVTGATDLNGKFTVPPGSVSASVMDGTYFDTSCQSCSTPAQPFVSRTAGLGLLSFGTGGTDQNGNGLSTRADRNAFYHLNIVRLVTKKWLSNSWVDTASFRANVNINSSCNAYYDGVSVNFYRSSSSCSNTGEISDVMQHEWGHGLDGHTAGGDGATGEATADTVAVHVTHSSIVGPWFRVGGGSVRDLDYRTTSKGFLSTTNVGGKCPAGSGPLGYQVHCEGEIYGQSTWDLANALVAKYGANTGWRESERLFFTSLPQAITYLPNQGGSVYDAYLAVDDDDGNLANGTPNAGEIFAALNPHGMGGTARASSPHCARPDQPVLTATAGCDKVTLSWNAVTGATQYRIGKTWMSGSAPFLDLATVSSGTLTYTDNDVTPGILYRYVVQAVNASGCESSINAEAFTMPVSRPRLDVTSVTVDDTPLGNRSGAIDPGESVDLRLTLSNEGDAAASGIGATLTSSTTGVTVTTSSATWPTIEAGSAGAGLSSFRIAVSPSVTCGTPIDLVLATTAAGVSCPLETNTIRLEVGVRSPVRIDHNFETTNSWAADAATTTATSGGWVRGTPVQTNYQPRADVTLNGTTCWHTGTNPAGNDDTNDVDGGVATLLSPVMDLTGLSTARLTYWRWFGQRDLGDDPTGDYYAVEASNNGGSNWTAIETLGDSTNAAAWTQKEIAVESFLPLSSNMRFRVRVSDANKSGDTGDIIEGAVDDFRITDSVCDLTPPCFTPPGFAGLGSAATGAGCGEADLAWAAGTSNCQNATVTYNVYRGTSPTFTPSPENRVATNVSALSFHDTGLAVGLTYYYIVRANDSRSGEDPNTVVRFASAADVVAPVFGGIVYSSPGYSCGEAVVSWLAGSDCTGPIRYDIYRSLDPLFTPAAADRVGESTSTAFIDAGLQAGTAYTYVVRARDAVGNSDTNLVRATMAAYTAPAGCSGCGAPAPVGRLLVRRQGLGVMLDWTADPVSAARFVPYRVSGPSLSDAVRLGSTTEKSWLHESATRIPGTLYYFVSAVDSCGQESAFDTEP